MYTPITQAAGTSWGKLEPAIYSRELIPVMWERLEPFIKRSLEHAQGTMTLQEMRFLLESGQATCFATLRNGELELVLVALKVNYATYSVCRVIVLAGTGLKEAAQFLDALEAWALTQGCIEIEGWCRPAMVKLTARLGWRTKFVIVSRDLRGKLQ